MHCTKCGIALFNVADENAHGTNVVERIQTAVLSLHFSPDAIDMFWSPRNFRLYAEIVEFDFERSLDLVNEFFPFASLLINSIGDCPVGIRLQIAKRQVLKLPLELPDAKAICERGINFPGFDGKCLLYCFWFALACAKPIQLLGNANDNEAYVFDHGQQHLAQGF